MFICLFPGSRVTTDQRVVAKQETQEVDSAKRAGSPSHYSPLSISLCAGTVPIGGAAAEEGGDASSALGLDEVNDGGMDEATRAAIACAYEGESGAWEGGEGGGAWAEAGG
jgi:hypothetical protein